MLWQYVYRVSIVTCNTTLHKKCSMCSNHFPAGHVDGTSNCCAHCTTACKECTLCSVAHRNLLQLLRQLYTIALTSGWMVVHLMPELPLLRLMRLRHVAILEHKRGVADELVCTTLTDCMMLQA